MNSPNAFRALISVTTCRRLPYLKRQLPLLAAFTVADERFSVLVSLDGDDQETRRFCDDWEVPLIWSDDREGVGVSKNRVLQRHPDFDYYFFLEDDAELVGGEVFPTHIALFEASGIHHFSLFESKGSRKVLSASTIAGHRVVHSLYGGADFNFFTREALEKVGGWHPRFAEYRRFGHTEHSYRIYRAGLAPAPFNVARDLTPTFIWHVPPAVTRVPDMSYDEDQIAAPERELMEAKLTRVPVQTLSSLHSNGVALGPLARVAGTLVAGRYPMLEGPELRHARSDYRLWQAQQKKGYHRATSLAMATVSWPGNPALRHTVKSAFRK